jgi:hypothetical protein
MSGPSGKSGFVSIVTVPIVQCTSPKVAGFACRRELSGASGLERIPASCVAQRLGEHRTP